MTCHDLPGGGVVSVPVSVCPCACWLFLSVISSVCVRACACGRAGVCVRACMRVCRLWRGARRCRRVS